MEVPRHLFPKHYSCVMYLYQYSIRTVSKLISLISFSTSEVAEHVSTCLTYLALLQNVFVHFWHTSELLLCTHKWLVSKLFNKKIFWHCWHLCSLVCGQTDDLQTTDENIRPCCICYRNMTFYKEMIDDLLMISFP